MITQVIRSNGIEPSANAWTAAEALGFLGGPGRGGHRRERRRSKAAIGEQLFLSVSAVEKNITAIFTNLGLTEERTHHRRVAAVLAFLGER